MVEGNPTDKDSAIDQVLGLSNGTDGEDAEYDQAVADIVNFLEYTGEPSKLESHKIGKWVLIFIAVLFVFVYLLKKEYWREVH